MKARYWPCFGVEAAAIDELLRHPARTCRAKPPSDRFYPDDAQGRAFGTRSFRLTRRAAAPILVIVSSLPLSGGTDGIDAAADPDPTDARRLWMSHEPKSPVDL